MNSTANAPYTSFERGPELLLTPAWQILRQQILHLAQFGGGVQVICGPEGAGKSTFLAFLQKAADTDGFHSWQVPAHCDNATLFRHMLQALGLRPGQQAGAGELIYSLRNYAQSLERSRQRLVFAFDDAHHLGNSELAALISVLQGSSESGFGLHFILLAEPGLAERIDELHLVDVSVQDVQLPPFSPAELNTVFSNTFLAPGEPLTLHGEVLERVWVQSEGLPGRALDMARALKTRPPEEEQPGFRFAGLPIWHMAALGLLGVVLLWALVFRDSTEAPQDGGTITASADRLNGDGARRTVPIEIVENPRPGRTQSAGPNVRDSAQGSPVVDASGPGRSTTATGADATIVGPDSAYAAQRSPVDGDVDVAPVDPAPGSTGDNALEATLSERLDRAQRDTNNESVAGADEPMADATEFPAVNIPAGSLPVDKAPAATPSTPSASASNSKPAPDAPVAEPVEDLPAQELDVKPAAGAAAPVVDTVELNDMVEQGEKALLALAPSGYVLQLMATTTEKALMEYVARQPNRRNLLVHSADRKGKRMYLLVEGFYADKDAALLAISNLPSEQQAGKPWPKKVSVIHEEIRQVRRN